MSRTIIKGSLLGGLIIFLWSAISWMVLPWHNLTMHTFKDEVAVAQVISANAPQSGVYFMPMQETLSKTPMPQIFASVHLEGATSMYTAMVVQLLIQIVAAAVVTWLLSKTQGLSYWGKVWFVMVFAFAAAVIAYLPYWNWFAFSTSYTFIDIADMLVAWFFAGLALAKITS